MIAKFPEVSNRKSFMKPVVVSAHQAPSLDEEEHAWIPWVFQRMRGECPNFFFEKNRKAKTRHEVLLEWKNFVEGLWSCQLAPAMLYTLQHAGDLPSSASCFLERRLRYHLETPTHRKSLELGAKLLEVTEGAKYQGALGRIRLAVSTGKSQPHLPLVWGHMAHLFQLLPRDMLVAYLQEEWRAMSRFEPSLASVPVGPLSFRAVAARNLRSYLREQTWRGDMNA